MQIDPTLADLIKAGIGALTLLLGKGIKDWIDLRRQGKLADEGHLVGNLTKALERQEEENDELRTALAFRTKERDYWHGDSGHVRFLYRSETGKEAPPTNPPTEE